MKKKWVIFMSLVMALLTACGTPSLEPNEKTETSEKAPVRIENKESNYSVWVAYWAVADFKKEFKTIEHDVANVSHFAAYFDEGGGLYLPKETRQTYRDFLKAYPAGTYTNYLSFVNDQTFEDRASLLKDTDLLYDLLSEETGRKQHVEEVLALVEAENFDGIEIDYEGLRDDFELWTYFVDFLEVLYQKSQEKNLSLRVLIEPNAPVEEVELPEGPQYVLMNYNLYGVGTEAGPKANQGFLEKMLEKSKYLPGEVDFALATGGNDFSETGDVTAVTEKESQELLTIYEKVPERDAGSQALNFTYTDDDGWQHEVWYADKETLTYWMSILKAAKQNKISLWKIGGNLEIDKVLNTE